MPTPDQDGPDISHWNPVADWDAIPDYPLFVAKATEGRSFRSPTFNENWRQMRNQGFRYRGAYHWVRSDATMAAQLLNLKRAIDDHGGLRRGEFIMIDWETTPGIRSLTWGEVKQFMWLCEAEWPGRVAVYASDWVPGFHEFRAEYPEYPLFYANYNLSTKTTGGPAETARYSADVWQWTSSFDGRPGIADDTIDMNDILDWSVLDRITDQVPVPEPVVVPEAPEPPPVVEPTPVPPSEPETSMRFETERRLFDSRALGPATLFAVQTGLAGQAIAVEVTVTVIPQGTPGWLSINPDTSFAPFGPDQAVSTTRPFVVQADGHILLGATTPVHILVDLVASHRTI